MARDILIPFLMSWPTNSGSSKTFDLTQYCNHMIMWSAASRIRVWVVDNAMTLAWGCNAVTNSLKAGCSTTVNGCRLSYRKWMASLSTAACGAGLLAAANLQLVTWLACLLRVESWEPLSWYWLVFDGCFRCKDKYYLNASPHQIIYTKEKTM